MYNHYYQACSRSHTYHQTNLAGINTCRILLLQQVFSDKEAERFPDSCPWGHAIDLIPEVPPILNCKVYPLAEGQQELLDKFLQEHEEKGYIR